MGNSQQNLCQSTHNYQCNNQSNSNQLYFNESKTTSSLNNNTKSNIRTSKQKIFSFEQNSFIDNKTLIYTQYHNNIRMEANDDNQSIIIHPLQTKLKIPRQQSVIIPVSYSEADTEIQELWNIATKQNLGSETQKVNIEDSFGRLLYQGEQRLGQKNGRGKQYFYDILVQDITKDRIQQMIDRCYYSSYEGNFENDMFSGNGILEFVDESTIYGRFIKGKPDGICTLECPRQNQIEQMVWENQRLIKVISMK